MLLLLKQEKKSISLFLFPGETSQIEPQMFHPQPQNNAALHIQYSSPGEINGGSQQTAQFACQVENDGWKQRPEGAGRRLCCLLESQSRYFPPAGRHLLALAITSLPFPSRART